MKNLAVVFFMLIIKTICYGQYDYRYSQPKELNDGWKTNNLRLQGVDTTRMYELFNHLNNDGTQIHSILLVKNNQLIIEEYFNGYTACQPHDLRSTTKSIRSILMGIAIDRGFIKNVNDPITSYLKHIIPNKNLDSRKEKITIKHLLTMSSGLDCNDWDKNSKGQEDKVYKKKDWLQYTLDLPMVNDSGTVSNYCSMGSILVAEIISSASGMTIDKFADEYLFKPMGISNLNWTHTSNKTIIPSGKRLNLTSRDMAKIGQLVLNKGTWNGLQIVSENWIEESTTPKTKITEIAYGYFWWNIPFQLNGSKLVSKTATGNGGQYIFVLPELDMVAVFTGGAYNLQEDKAPFVIMNKLFLPLFQNK